MPGRERPSSGGELMVAQVVGVHGIRGAVRARLHDPDSAALTEGRVVRLCAADGRELHRGKLERVAPKPGTKLIRLWVEGVPDRDSAERLRDARVWIDREQLPRIEADEYYMADAIGCTVLEDGRALGTIVGITSNRAQDLFEVEWRGSSGTTRRWMFPALPEFVVALDDEGVHVSLPPGFLPTELERRE